MSPLEPLSEANPARVATALAIAQDRVEEVFTAVRGSPNGAGQCHPTLVYDQEKLRQLVIDILEVSSGD